MIDLKAECWAGSTGLTLTPGLFSPTVYGQTWPASIEAIIHGRIPIHAALKRLRGGPSPNESPNGGIVSRLAWQSSTLFCLG